MLTGGEKPRGWSERNRGGGLRGLQGASRASSGRSEEGVMRRSPLQDRSNHLPGQPSANQGQGARSAHWSRVPTRLWGGFLQAPRQTRKR